VTLTRTKIACAVALPALALVVSVTGQSTAVPGGGQPWMSSALPASQRAALLVRRMSLDEKIAMVHGAGYPVPFNAAGYAGVIPANRRLGIPAVYLADSPVGVGNGSTGVTQWADTAALASTWNPSLADAFGRAYGAEQAGKGHNVALAPTINILRTPFWGRAPETFSEDPYLTGRQAAAEIRGIQSNHVIATAKHFDANNQEVLRSSINVVAGQRTLAEIYQPAFRAAIRQGHVGAVMCSYNRVGGTYACENAELLTDTLHQAWHFDGLVMSDWGALHSTLKAAKAGLDLEMPGVADDANQSPIDRLFGSYFNTALKDAVQQHRLSMATLDRMVRHILTAMFRIGLFDHRLPSPASVKNDVVSTPAHRALSTRIATRGTVLLKNARSTPPIHPAKVHSIAVIGDAAFNHPQTAAGGSATVLPSAPVVTPLRGITARAASGVTVTGSAGTLGLGPLPAVPATAFPGGVRATYYATSDLSGAPVGTETVPNLDYTGAPAAVASLSTWSARYAGTLRAPATAAYRFTLQAGAYVTVRIDGKPVVRYAPFRESVRNGLVHLTKGDHSIRVRVTPFPYPVVTVDTFATSPALHLGWQPFEGRPIRAAASAASAADLAVVVVADPTSEGWDRSTLALPADQNRLISAVAAANRNTVVVLDTASAVSMPWLTHVAAVVEAWYPGQTDGTALARVLFGDVNPSGKLPVTFPRSNHQRPARKTNEYPGDGHDVYYDEGLRVGYRWYDATHHSPLFPFGFGLSYTRFRISHLQVTRHGNTYSAAVTVRNTGARAGADVVQLYVGYPAGAGEPPRSLKGYTKVGLQPGASRHVTITLTRSAFRVWDSLDRGWRLLPGTYRISVGDSSRHLPTHAAVSIS